MPHLIFRTLLIAVLVLAATTAPPVALADPVAPAAAPDARADRPDKLEFVRFSDDGKGGGTLDTAIATYTNPQGVVVHLVAAIHVGEGDYFKKLGETFEDYDVLLYEMVKPKDMAIPGRQADAPDGAPADARDGAPAGATRARGAGAISGLQVLLKDVLGLEFQLDAIDYSRPNFVHADLDAETFNAMQEERGESIFALMLRSVVHEMKRDREGGDGPPAITAFDLLAAMASPDSTRQYKLLLGRQFAHIESQLEGLEGEDGSVIIAERNKAAIGVLKRTLEQRKPRVIGVFYGAGHMRGIEDELVSKMGFTRTGVEWRTAWDMREAEETDVNDAGDK